MPKKAASSRQDPTHATGPSFALELEHGGRVAGIDEAGLGPLAGPVLAAAVVFPSGVPMALAAILDDSKKLTPSQRERAYAALLEAAAAGVAEIGVGAASAAEIGILNVLRASHLAMQRALRKLPSPPDIALVDGNKAPPLTCPVRCIVKGDSISQSIAAASILAKFLRDRAMTRLHPRFPEYGFAVHAGYPTPAHMAAIARLGITRHHRRGFSPVDQPTLGF